jgi:hypothetical protein
MHCQPSDARNPGHLSLLLQGACHRVWEIDALTWQWDIDLMIEVSAVPKWSKFESGRLVRQKQGSSKFEGFIM